MGEKNRNRVFKTFIRDCKNSSPMYAYLTQKMMHNDELLRLSEEAPKKQPQPNLLFGAVHYLLLKGFRHPLASYYPSIVKRPQSFETILPVFIHFCKIYRQNILHLMKTKTVQTNEVRRCAYLFPLFQNIYQQVKQPLALIEVGTSAGLQLLWDHYKYSYPSGKTYGNKKSAVHITSEIRGIKKPPFQIGVPPVSHRVGLDLHINDLSDQENLNWLLALIWPENEPRRILLKEASQYVQKEKVHFIEGDGVELLSKVVQQIPQTSTVCIFHTHVANQLSFAQKGKLLDQVEEIGKSRNIFHIYNNMYDQYLHFDSIVKGRQRYQTVGKTDSHGRWFTWELED